MTLRSALLWSLCLLSLAVGSVRTSGAEASAPTAKLPLVRIRGGQYRPLQPPTPELAVMEVGAFMLMTRPVRNDEFLAFVAAEPSYRRDQIARALADEQYLTHWESATSLGSEARPHQPVTRVSWFAARAFCHAQGLRLPTEAEWELAAAASATERDARTDPTFRARILDWYARPNQELVDVPSEPANLYGVSDLHGVIWEWVEDFNNDVVSVDSRGQGDSAGVRSVCGGAALSATDSLDYPAFLRLAFRSALRASYTTSGLGFRCARDLAKTHSKGSP